MFVRVRLLQNAAKFRLHNLEKLINFHGFHEQKTIDYSETENGFYSI